MQRRNPRFLRHLFELFHECRPDSAAPIILVDVDSLYFTILLVELAESNNETIILCHQKFSTLNQFPVTLRLKKTGPTSDLFWKVVTLAGALDS